MLLLEKNGRGRRYALPGGAQYPGEPLQAALQRDVRLTATEHDEQNRISIRISWQDRDRAPGAAALEVK